jgi:hypothetical protein
MNKFYTQNYIKGCLGMTMDRHVKRRSGSGIREKHAGQVVLVAPKERKELDPINS